MWRGRVYVLAKEPRAGAVKTRLCPPLVAERACELAVAFAEDTLGRLAGLREAARIDVRLALDDGGTGAESSLRVLADRLGIEVEDQGDGDLGARMARLVERGLAGGAPAILVGTDSPDLPPEMLRAAARALTRADVVLAPAEDGGYVLVGARRPVRALFEIEAPWSGPQVFESTCRALRHAHCSFETLPAWDDVDDAAALARLARRLEESGGAGAPATARLLAEWKREGVRF
jgi:rSAM/selenodomain-associated transferase 1